MKIKDPKLSKATRDYGQYHAQKTEAEAKMAEARAAFFDAITFSEDELARITVFYTGKNPDAWISAQYPRWRVVKRDKTGVEWKILLEEDPAYKPFVFVNPTDGKVYQRSFQEGAPQPDLERIREQDIELYQRITFQPQPPRELKPAEQINEDDWERVQDYLLPPKITPVMTKPRDAKPEELEDA